MGSRFFKPFVGENYDKGINGKKVLVLGASFYCKEVSCKYFEECTSVDKKDSSPFDTKCTVVDYKLSDEPLNEIESTCDEGTYKKFANEMMKFTGTSTSKDTWNCFAFTNYVQFFLPGEEGRFRLTLRGDLSERDYEAFNETLRELKPDIVIVWGTVFSSRIMRDNEYLVDENELEESEGYLCHIKLPDMEKQVTLVNPYHPSSSAWYSNMEKFEFYFEKAIRSAIFESLSEEALSIVQTFAYTHNDEYKKLIVSLYATIPNANNKMLQALEECCIDLNTELAREEMETLQKEYKAVVRYCYGKDHAGAKDSRPTHWLPRTLLDLCISIMRPKPGSEILLPYAGDAQFAHDLPECSFDGYEPDSKIWAYSQIVCDAFSANARIQFGNFKDIVDEKMYDYVFSCPLGRDLQTGVDELCETATKCLKDNGVMCCVFPESFCTETAPWYKLREIIFDRKWQYSVEVVLLPSMSWHRYKENMCVLFLFKNDKDDITLMDACHKDLYRPNREWAHSGGNPRYMINTRAIIEALHSYGNKFVWHGTSDELLADAILLPKLYLVNKLLQAPSDGEKRVKLGDVIKIVPGSRLDNGGKVASLFFRDLSDDPLNCDIFYKDVASRGSDTIAKMLGATVKDAAITSAETIASGSGGITSGVIWEIMENSLGIVGSVLRDAWGFEGQRGESLSNRKLSKECLLVGYFNGKFRVGKANDLSTSNSIRLSRYIIPFKLRADFISEEFLLRCIMTENVERQAEIIVSNYDHVSYMSYEDFLQIEILVPPIKKQRQLYKEDVRKSLTEAEQKLSGAFEEYQRDIHMQKHAIGQTISSLTGWWKVLNRARQENNGDLKDSITVGRKKPITVGEVYDNLENTIFQLQQQIYKLDRGYDFQSEEIALTVFIEEYISKNQGVEFEYEYNAEKHYGYMTEMGMLGSSKSDSDCTERKIPLETAYFSRAALSLIFDNIVDNACKHGFAGRSGENIIRIELESYGSDHIIIVANNGDSIHSEISQADVFTYGRSSKSGKDHSGIGGYEIKKLMEKFDGDAEIISTPTEKFKVAYKLIFHKTNI